MGKLTDYAAEDSLKLANEFRVDGLDLAGFPFPELQVKSWTSLTGNFGEGSVSVEAEHHFPGKGYPTRFTLAEAKVAHPKQKAQLVKQYKALVDEWNEDNRGNWLRALRQAVEYVASHHEKQIIESRVKFDVATGNLDWLASQEG